MIWSTTVFAECLPRPRWQQLLNPVWLLSDQERNPRWSWWAWFKRNPCANLFAVGIGVACFRRTVRGTMDGQNFPAAGWGCHIVFTDEATPRPWIAWRGKHHEFGAGWKTHGGFGINWRRANSTNATPEAPT